MQKKTVRKRVKSDPKPKVIEAINTDSATQPFVDIIQHIHGAKGNARFVVIVGHSFVELIVNELVKRRCKRGNDISKDSRYPHSLKVNLLMEMGVISDHHFRLLEWFRKLRNKCAHQPFFALKNDDLSIFADERMRNLSEFHNAVTRIIADLIVEFKDDIGPEFVPSNYTRVEHTVPMKEVAAPVYKIPLIGDPSKVQIPDDAD